MKSILILSYATLETNEENLRSKIATIAQATSRVFERRMGGPLDDDRLAPVVRDGSNLTQNQPHHYQVPLPTLTKIPIKFLTDGTTATPFFTARQSKVSGAAFD